MYVESTVSFSMCILSLILLNDPCGLNVNQGYRKKKLGINSSPINNILSSICFTLVTI